MKHILGFRELGVVVLCSVILAAFAQAQPAQAPPLLAGFATADITPPVGYRLCGYFYERVSTGQHDPLMAKAIVFGQGDTRVALVFCDLIAIPAEISGAAKQRISESAGIPRENIVICCTHTHTGPLYYGVLRTFFHERAIQQKGSDPLEQVDYSALLVGAIAEAAGKAAAQVAPVDLRFGRTDQEGLSFNRRFYMGDGTVRFNPGLLNAQIVRAAGPIDPAVSMVLLTPHGASVPRGVLYNFTMHLDTVGGTEFGADYPFYVQQRLQEIFGPEFISVFAQGTCGDINHIDVASPSPYKGQEQPEHIGSTLATTIHKSLPGLDTAGLPSLAMKQTTIEVRLQNFTPDDLAWAKQTIQGIDSSTVSFMDKVRACTILDLAAYPDGVAKLDIQALRLSDELAAVFLPSEVFVELGLGLKDASPFDTTLVVELANACIGYVPTAKGFAEGSYEIQNSRIQPGYGEAIAEAGRQLLYALKFSQASQAK